ncbi:MAG TPA: hypothetical protein VKE71_15780 [Candidatus Angelobacter sp.]|nr:hypothetical protein [Candidatus Angelobacter sp.]
MATFARWQDGPGDDDHIVGRTVRVVVDAINTGARSNVTRQEVQRRFHESTLLNWTGL